MDDKMVYNPPHWNFFRLLERDLEECFHFVAPVTEHYGVYSDRFARIILMACSELENAVRGFAKHTKHAVGKDSFWTCLGAVVSKYPSFSEMKIKIPRHNINLQPWSDYDPNDKTRLDWWDFGYNKIKHDRLSHPKAPTMSRAINSVGALFVILMHYYKLLYGNRVTFPMEIVATLYEGDVEGGSEGATICWGWNIPDFVE